MKLPENDISTIQIDGPKRQVFIKFANTERMQHVLQETDGQMEFRHDNGELSMAKIEPAGMGVRRIRIENLPPEVHDRIIREMLTKYGEVRDITEDAWSRIYRYKVF
jgi:RNA recognition motif-containing protein